VDKSPSHSFHESNPILCFSKEPIEDDQVEEGFTNFFTFNEKVGFHFSTKG